MADREYIVEILLKARDDTARAFAAATGNLEAYKAAIANEKRIVEESRKAHKAHAEELTRGTTTLDKHKRSAEALSKQYQDLGTKFLKDEESIKRVTDKMAALEAAQRKLTKAENEGRGSTINHQEALNGLLSAQADLAKTIQQVEGIEKDVAARRAQRVQQVIKNQIQIGRIADQRVEDERRVAKAAEEAAKIQEKADKEAARAKEKAAKEAAKAAEDAAERERKAQERAARAVANVRKRDIADQKRAEKELLDFLNSERAKAEKERLKILDQGNRADTQARNERQKAEDQRQGEISRIVTGAVRPANILARTDVSQTQEVQAARELIVARDRLRMSGDSLAEADRRIHVVRQQALADYGHESQAARDTAKYKRDEAEAYKLVANAIHTVESADKAAERTAQTAARARRRGRPAPISTPPRVIDDDTRTLADVKLPGGGGGGAGGSGGGPGGAAAGAGGFENALGAIQGQMARLDTSTSGFEGHLRSAFGFAAVTLIQPLSALIVGLVGAFGALASAAIAAGTAIGASFLAAIAQGIPVMGLFAASMQRLQTIMGYVQAVQQQAQQRFIAQYETAQQTAMGINQVVIAQHNYSDALYGSQQAVRNVIVAEHGYSDALFSQQNAVYAVRVAQLGLSTARRDATRQLQQLIFQEVNAKLAAQASTLAITNSQKALQQAIATGGDVQAAQLQLSQARAQHTQALASAHQSIADAAPGSIARQNIAQTVEQARQGVVQAQHAVTDANFALAQAQQGIVSAQRAVIDARFQVAQARAAIIQAQQAAAGYNLATAAQLAWLRSQMTQTERSLANNITQIYQMFQGVHGRLRPVTDAILSAFVPLTSQIIKVFNDPRIFGALLNLGQKMGGAIKSITNVVFSNQSLNNFITILKDAAQNLAPLAAIAGNMFRVIQAVVVAAGPALNTFLGYISDIVGKIADWANSSKGQKELKDWFTTAFGALQSFVGLGLSIIKLIAAIVGVGGGAKAGIGIIQDFKRWIDRTTDAINHHKGIFNDLKKLWASAHPAIHALGVVLGAIVGGLIKIGTSKQGISTMQGLAHLISDILVPAFVKFAQIIGSVTDKILGFLHKHPQLRGFLVDFIALSAAMAVGFKAIGLIFGPLAGAIGTIATLVRWIRELNILTKAMAIVQGIITAVTYAWDAAVGILNGELTILEALELATGFAEIAAVVVIVVAAIAGLVVGIIELVKHFKEVKKWVVEAFGTVKQWATEAWHAVVHAAEVAWKAIEHAASTAFHTVVNWFKKTGSEAARGLWEGIKSLPGTILNLFKRMVNAVLHWLGISSPSRVFSKIGQAMIDGIIFVFVSLPEKIIHIFGKLLALIESWGKKLWNAGWSVGNTVVNGITTAFHAVLGWIKGAINDAIISPLNWMIDRINGLPKINLPFGLGKIGIPHIGHIGKLAEGGPVDEGGYGGGDRHLALLESGEHVLAKEEVRAAGGHGAVFAMRKMLGGGGQGGRGRYAEGGQIGGMGQLGLQNPSGQTTQGVTGLMGSVLANIQTFTKQAANDWNKFWDTFNGITQTNMNWEVKEWRDRFNDILDIVDHANKDIAKHIRNFWDDTNKHVQESLNKLLFNYDWTYKKIDTDSFNAFWYIMHIAQQAIDAFGQKFTPPHLAQQPKMTKAATGGFIGQMGERGRDLIHAVLGRGEAVLNYAHQKIVDPAMRAYYGFGLDKMFKKIRGEHAGEGEGMAGGGYAGYSLPLPKEFMGGSWSPDEGVDINGGTSAIANAPLYAIGPGKIIREGLDGFGPNAPVLLISDGPLKGRAIYYGHAGADTVGRGAVVRAGQQISRVGAGIVGLSSGPHLEIGFADPSTGAPIGSSTAGAMVTLLHQLLAGAGVSGINVPGGGGGATWTDIAIQAVRGTGALAQLMKAGIKKVTDAANKFGAQQAGQAGGTTGGQVGANWTGPWVSVMGQIAKKFNWNLDDWKWLVNAESSGNPEIVNPTSGAFGLGQFLGATAQAYAKYGALSHNPVKQIEAMAQYILDRYVNPTRAKAFHLANTWYRSGGFADGQPVQITAHVGEWVLNKLQQAKLAQRMGVPITKLKNMLGLTSGKTHFKDGGVVGEEVTQARSIGLSHVDLSAVTDFIKALARIPHAHINLSRRPTTVTGTVQQFLSILAAMNRNEVQKFLDPWVKGMQRHMPVRQWTSGDYPAEIGHPTSAQQFISRLRLIRPDPTGRFTGNIDWTSGAFTAPQVTTQNLNLLNNALARYNTAQQIVNNIRKNSKLFAGSLDQFIKNFNTVGGDGGLFANAAQAIQDFVNRQTTIVSLAASGFKVANYAIQRLRGGPQSIVEAAQADLDSTNREITAMAQNQRQLVSAIHAVQKRIQRFGQVTAKNMGNYQQLIGDRHQLIGLLDTADQNLTQAYSDRYTKASALFTAQVQMALRGNTTLSGGEIGAITLGVRPGSSGLQSSFNNLQGILNKVGPTIASGVAQMAQSIAQTLADPNKLRVSDQALVDIANQQHEILQKQYTQAAARARTDKRWQSVADDLLGQLESSVSALVQAQGQALQDAIQSQDTQQQIASAALTFRDTLAQALAASSSVAGPANQYAAIAAQIGTSRDRAQKLQEFLPGYQDLLNQAKAQGNIGAQNTLQQTIDTLTGEIAQANLQTQQLITSQRQLGLTIMNSQVQASSSFYSAANGIAQTLGAIAGSQNLPALISYARSASDSILKQAQNAVDTIRTALASDPQTGQFAFGANQGGATALLDQLVTAFKQGAQPFADTLAKMSDQLSIFESGLPQDQQTLFQNLVQSLIDNTTAQVNNTQQLQQLNATTNQQQFTSSAWTMFRNAIFNGLGGLLPQYAMTVPSADVGGFLTSSGLLYGHKGETVMPASMSRGAVGGNTYHENHFEIDHPVEVADPVLFGNAVAWRLNHDPNSR